MKAYGLARQIRYSLALRTEVASVDGSEEANIIRIREPKLEATQINHLQALVGSHGWEVLYRDGFLALVPEGENGTSSGGVPD